MTRAGPPGVVPARTWLARTGWRKRGLLHIHECPRLSGWSEARPALGARLAGPLAEPSSLDALAVGDSGPLTVGDDCTPRTLQSAVGLVWRAVILWMILLLMLTLAVWVS